MNNSIFILLNKENNYIEDCKKSISNLKLEYVDFGLNQPDIDYDYIIELDKDFNGYFNCVILYELLEYLNINNVSTINSKYLLKCEDKYTFEEHNHNNYFSFKSNIENHFSMSYNIEDWLMLIFCNK